MAFLNNTRASNGVPDPNYSLDPQQPPAKTSWLARITDDLLAAVLEYVGTTVFLLLAFGGVQASSSEAQSASQSSTSVDRVMYISLCFGFSLLVSAWLFYRVTGGLFNPDVSLALLITGVIGPVRFVFYCIAQLLGGITAAAIVYALTPGPLASNTYLAPGVNRAQGVFIEMFATSALVLAVLMLAAEKHATTPFAPIGIGLTLFVGHLWAVYFTGAGINTARSFGPAVVTGFPYNSHWVYWLGPFLGALLGSAFYALLKHVKYWRINPGQESIDHRQSPQDPVRNMRSSISSMRSSRSRSDRRQPLPEQFTGTNTTTTAATTTANEKPVAPNETVAVAQGDAPLVVNDAPLVVNDAPLVVNDAPLVVNDAPLAVNDRPFDAPLAANDSPV